MRILPTCMYCTMCVSGACGSLKRDLIPWNWGYEWLWSTTWVWVPKLFNPCGARLGCELSDVGAENQFGLLWKNIAHTGEPSLRPSFPFPYAFKNYSPRGWTAKASARVWGAIGVDGCLERKLFFFRGVATSWWPMSPVDEPTDIQAQAHSGPGRHSHRREKIQCEVGWMLEDINGSIIIPESFDHCLA